MTAQPLPAALQVLERVAALCAQTAAVREQGELPALLSPRQPRIGVAQAPHCPLLLSTVRASFSVCHACCLPFPPALVFCGTKAGCEVAAKSLAKSLGQVPELPRQEGAAPTPAGPASTPATPAAGTATPTRAGFADQLRQMGTQGDSKAAVLGGLVERGLAFHHAGALLLSRVVLKVLAVRT